MSKEITKYWEETCIDFGKYVQQQWARHEDSYMLWLEFQEQMAKDVEEILDGADRCEKDNTLNTNEQEGDVNGNFTTERLEQSIDELEGLLTKHTDTIEILSKICGVHDEKIKLLNKGQKTPPNDALKKAAEKYNEYVKAKLEEAEAGGFYDGIPRDALNMELKQEEEYNTLADAHQEERADQYEGKTLTGGLSPDTGPRN